MALSIKAIIFDLDNCLAPANEAGEEIYAPVFMAMRKINDGRVTDDNLEKAFKDCWRYPLDWVAAKYGFSDEVLRVGQQGFANIQVKGPLYGYGDLPVLRDLTCKRYLVTSGFRRLQESKIAALSIQNLFSGIYIDAIEEPDRLGKQGLFELIMRTNNFTAGEILVVGDSSESEIAAGNNLGMTTIQTLRAGVPKSESATYIVPNLTELRDLFIKLHQE